MKQLLIILIYLASSVQGSPLKEGSEDVLTNMYPKMEHASNAPQKADKSALNSAPANHTNKKQTPPATESLLEPEFAGLLILITLIGLSRMKHAD